MAYVITGEDGVFQSCRNWHLGDDVRIDVQRDGFPDMVVTRRFESALVTVKVIVDRSP